MGRSLLIGGTVLLVVILFMVLFRGPTGPGDPPPPPETPRPVVLLQAPVAMQRVEHAVEALSVWRQYAASKPTLLLLSNALPLQTPPKELHAQIDELAAKGRREDLARRGNPQASDPLVLPTMALDVALRSGWFGEVFWAPPLKNPEADLHLESLCRQLRDEGLMDAAEAESLHADGHLIRGRVRDLPLVVAPLAKLPEMTGPVVLHLDQSYFQQLYKNEIATPIFPIIYATLEALRTRHLQVLAVTFDQGNLDERVALDVRFVSEFIRELLAQPEMFAQPAAEHWKQQADILYLNNFFQKERVGELSRAIEQAVPDGAWVQFNLFQSAAAHKDGTAALNYLAKAVRLDSIYALEYLELARLAHDKGRPDEALRMLGLAAAALPEMVQIRIQMAQVAAEVGDKQQALGLVRELRKRPWSSHYHPEMPSYLESFEHFLTDRDAQSKPSSERTE